MSDEAINAIIAEATAPEAAPKADVESSAPVGDNDNVETETESNDPEPSQDEMVVFPKKAINALSRRDKKIGKLQAELAALRAAQQPAQAKNQQPDNRAFESSVKEEDYDNYGDFIVARAEEKILKSMQAKGSEEQARQAEQHVQQQISQWAAEREQTISSKRDEYAKSIPDYMAVVSEAADIADDFPEHIAQVFYEAEDAALAFYNLAKEGKLEALATMTPTQAAVLVDRATRKPQINKVSSAPTPISGSTGSSRTQKRLEDMSGEEIIKKLGIKA